MKTYVHEVGLASETIMEALEAAHETMEDAGIEDRFPETVFDTALRVLIPAWGPDHVRRAIIEQCAVFIKGRVEVVNFMEPTRVLDPSAVRRRPMELAVKETPQAAPQRSQEFDFKPRVVRDRRVRAFVASDLLPNGKAVWAVAMAIRDDSGRYEFRKFGGRIDDSTGSRVTIVSLHEACLALVGMKDKAHVSIEMSDEALAKAAEAKQPGEHVRRDSDKATWAEIDYAVTLHDLSFRHVPPALTDSLQESCDHLMRELAQS
jgi:hypothetical protein